MVFLFLTGCTPGGAGSSILEGILGGSSEDSTITGDSDDTTSDTTSGNQASEESSSSSSSSEDSEDSGDSDSPGSEDLDSASPYAESPSAPSTLTLDTETTVAYATDSTDAVPVTGSAGTADYEDGAQIALSTEAYTLLLGHGEYRLAGMSTQGRGNWASRRGMVRDELLAMRLDGQKLFMKAYDTLVADAHAEGDECDSDTVSCCPINADGSFECYLPLRGQSVSTIYAAIVNAAGEIASITDDNPDGINPEAIHSNLLYVDAEPTDAAIAASDDATEVFALTGTSGVKASFNADSGLWVMQGSADESYRSFTSTGSKLAYNNSLLGSLNTSAGVALFTVADGSVTDTGVVATSEGATGYTVVKEVNDMLLYGTEHAASSEAYVNVADGERSSSRNEEFTRIQYLSCTDETSTPCTDETSTAAADCDCDDDGGVMKATKVLAVDGMEFGGTFISVVYVDDADQVRVRFVEYNAAAPSYANLTHFGGTSPLAISSTSLKDIVIYHEQSSSSEDSRIAILDSDGDRVIFGTFNVSSQVTEINTDDAVNVGDNPIGMTFHGSRLYVLNAGDQSISVVRLFNSNGTTPRERPVVSATFRLAGLITDKASLTFSPQTIVASDDKLLISDQANKALVVVDRDEITEDSVVDEEDSAEDTDTEADSDTGSDTNTGSTTDTSTGTDNSSRSSREDSSTSSSTDSDSATGTETATSTGTASSTSTETSTSTSTSTSTGRGSRGR